MRVIGFTLLYYVKRLLTGTVCEKRKLQRGCVNVEMSVVLKTSGQMMTSVDGLDNGLREG